jgi:hypothetical protein
MPLQADKRYARAWRVQRSEFSNTREECIKSNFVVLNLAAAVHFGPSRNECFVEKAVVAVSSINSIAFTTPRE